MVAVNEKTLNRKPGRIASRRRRSLCRSVISVAGRSVDCVAPTCRRGDFPLSVAAFSSPQICHKTHFTHHSLFHSLIERSATLRSPPLPRGSKNFVSSWLCGEKSASGTQPLVHNPYQGMTLDSVTGLYYERNRNYSPSLGTWISQDPMQYINGANTYQFVMSNPVNAVDPWGLDKSDAFVNGLAAQLGGADWLNNQAQNTGQTGGQILGQAIQQQFPAPLLAAANLPNAVNPHTLAEGLADTAQGVQNGLIGMINFDFNHGPVGLALHELQQWVKTIRGWPCNVSSPQWDPYNDPTKPLSEGLGSFAGPTLLLGPLGEVGSAEDGLATVSRWGRPGLQSGDRVMNGPANFWNYTFSFQYQPGLGNEFAPFGSGQEFTVPSSSVQWPTGWGWDGAWKGLFGQRRYFPPAGGD